MNDYYGAQEKTSDKDYLGSEIDIPRAPKGTNSFILNGATQINQVKIASYTCTITSAMGTYSDLTGYKFSDEDKQAIYQEALKRGFNTSVGWYISSAVHLIYDWVNEHCEDKVNYYRLDVGSWDFGMAMRLGYSVVVGYSGSQLFSLDKGDGILDETSFSKRLYGHCLRVAYSIGDEYDLMIDNYPYKHLNIYRVPTRNWKKLVENNVFFKFGYIFVIK